MEIAIFGATSQIAKDFILLCLHDRNHRLILFSRNVDLLNVWLSSHNIKDKYQSLHYENFNQKIHYDAIINFIGVGNPVKTEKMGSSIFDITVQYDTLVMGYLKIHKNCKYIFLSSGAAYGDNFQSPVKNNSNAIIPINNIESKNWYGMVKLYIEVSHRMHQNLSIVDVRVFNYFSRTQDMNNGFLITSIVSAIKNKRKLVTDSNNITRDYIHPSDFKNLIFNILLSNSENLAVDCYSKKPIGKFELLEMMEIKFDLKYEIKNHLIIKNPTGNKENYYSKNKIASMFNYKPKYTSIKGLEIEISKCI